MTSHQLATRWGAAVLIVFGGLSACAAPSTPIPAAPIDASASEALPTARGFATEVDAYLTDRMDLGAFSGIVEVVQDGEVLFQQGYGYSDRERQAPHSAETRYRIGSLTVGFTAMAILQLQAMGKLNVQDKVCAHLAECPVNWEAITLHHLLTHTSGIRDYTVASDFAETMGQPTTPKELIASFQDEALRFEPGATWDYSSSGYVVLGAVIEHEAGVPYEAFVQDHVLSPLKLTHTGFDQQPDGLAVGYKNRKEGVADYADMSVAYSAWGMSSTVEDLLLWSQTLTTDALVPAETRDLMLQPYADVIGQPWDYAYGWLVGQDFGHAEAFHWGYANGFTSALKVFPGDHITIVVLSNQGNVNAIGIAHEIVKILFED